MPADRQDAVALVEPFRHLADLGEGHGVEAPVESELQLAELAAGDGREVARGGPGVGIAFDLKPGAAGQQVVLVAVHDAFLADLVEPLEELARLGRGLRVGGLDALRAEGEGRGGAKEGE